MNTWSGPIIYVLMGPVYFLGYLIYVLVWSCCLVRRMGMRPRQCALLPTPGDRAGDDERSASTSVNLEPGAATVNLGREGPPEAIQ